MEPTEGALGCVACKDGYFRSNNHSQSCQKCPQYFTSDTKHHSCEPFDILNIDSDTRIHLNTFKPSHSESMCNSMQAKAYCSGDFYGPIFENDVSFDGEMFYFSGLEKKYMIDQNDMFTQENNNLKDMAENAGFMYGVILMEANPMIEHEYMDWGD